MVLENHHSILVEVANNSDADNNVTVACIEYIIKRSYLRQSRNRARSFDLGEKAKNVAILTMDTNKDEYKGLCERCSIAHECIWDAYSQWYAPTPSSLNPSGEQKEEDDKIHIAQQASLIIDKNKEKESNAPLYKLLNKIINKISKNSNDNEIIIIIDSLSSLLRYTNVCSVKSFISIRNYLLTSIDNSKYNNLILMMTMRSEEIDKSQIHSLNPLFDSHVKLFQSLPLLGNGNVKLNNRDDVYMDVRRRKPSGRVALEYIDAKMDHSMNCIMNENVRQGKRPSKRRDGDQVVGGDEGDDLELAQRGLTFRLTLSSKEREMRAAAGLPYVHQDENLADSALELHPKSLQIDNNNNNNEGDGDYDDYDVDDDDDDIEEDEEGELFSEDV